MKKVLIFSTNYFPYIGGAEVAIKEITDRAEPAEITFHMVVPRYSKENKIYEQIGNVSVYRVGFGHSFDKWIIPFTGLKKAAALHKKNNYTHSWAMMASQASIAAAWFKKRFPEVRLILTLQEGDEESHLKRYVFGSDVLYTVLIRPFYMSVFRVADHITAISHYLRKRAERNSPNASISIIPNGVDIYRFKRENNPLLRERLGISQGAFVVITTSRLVLKNGVEYLVRASQELPNVVFLIVGDGELRTQLEAMAGDNVLFAGNVVQDEIPQYISIANAFCRASLSEGQGISFLEAMASELPVIATQVGGISDFLFDAQKNPERKPTGFAVDVCDHKTIVEAITFIQNNPQKVASVVENARAMVEERYDWDIIAKQMKRVFISNYV